MLHLGAVFLAHRSTALAGLNTGAELGAGELEVGASEARNDARGGKADIGAVSAIPNALHHLGDVLLPKARVGAGVAGFGAGVTGRDAFNDGGVVR